jgi:type IX secretion system PorP/SprF family membrane protein
MKQFLLTISSLLLLVLTAQAQDEAIFSHYNLTPILLNPAAAGFDDSHQLQFNARAQWTGFDDAPTTLAARYNGPIGRTFGLGIGVVSEQAAQINRLKLQLDYAFRFSIEEDWKLSFGFFTQFNRMQVDNDITAGAFYDPSDNLLEDLLNGKFEFDAAVGVFGSYRDNTYGGLTFNNLVSSRLSDIAGGSNDETFFSYYSFLFGHRFEINDPRISLEPSVMMRNIRNAPFQMDVNLKAGFLDDQLIAGVSYRSLGALGILLGTRLTNFNLYYSYDVSFQRFQKYNTGSHEVTIVLSVPTKRTGQSGNN